MGWGFPGLSRFRDKRWDVSIKSEGLNDQTFIRGLYEDRDGTIWVASRDGIFRRRSGGHRFERHTQPIPRRAEANESRFISDIGQDSSGRMWFVGLDQTLQRGKRVMGCGRY